MVLTEIFCSLRFPSEGRWNRRIEIFLYHPGPLSTS
jgi:hypothetical protein